MQRIFALCFALLLSFFSIAPSAMTIRIPAPESAQDPRYLYYFQLLQLALDHTPEKGQYQLVTYPRDVPQSRAFSLINAGEIDLLWSMTDLEREAHFLPIRIPLMQGLLGYRVILIKKQDEALFAHMSVQELKQLPCYQGQDWPDTAILAANHFKVRGVVDFKRIHTMLDRGNVRCFPRGLLEAWAEVESKGLKNIMVDPHFLLIYPADAYYFVHKENKALAALVEQGLRAAIADGSFKQFLYGYPTNKRAFEQARLEQREVIHLKNPLLPPLTPLNEKQLWFSVSGTKSSSE